MLHDNPASINNLTENSNNPDQILLEALEYYNNFVTLFNNKIQTDITLLITQIHYYANQYSSLHDPKGIYIKGLAHSFAGSVASNIGSKISHYLQACQFYFEIIDYAEINGTNYTEEIFKIISVFMDIAKKENSTQNPARKLVYYQMAEIHLINLLFVLNDNHSARKRTTEKLINLIDIYQNNNFFYLAESLTFLLCSHNAEFCKNYLSSNFIKIDLANEKCNVGEIKTKILDCQSDSATIRKFLSIAHYILSPTNDILSAAEIQNIYDRLDIKRKTATKFSIKKLILAKQDEKRNLNTSKELLFSLDELLQVIPFRHNLYRIRSRILLARTYLNYHQKSLEISHDEKINIKVALDLCHTASQQLNVIDSSTEHSLQEPLGHAANLLKEYCFDFNKDIFSHLFNFYVTNLLSIVHSIQEKLKNSNSSTNKNNISVEKNSLDELENNYRKVIIAATRINLNPQKPKGKSNYVTFYNLLEPLKKYLKDWNLQKNFLNTITSNIYNIFNLKLTNIFLTLAELYEKNSEESQLKQIFVYKHYLAAYLSGDRNVLAKLKDNFSSQQEALELLELFHGSFQNLLLFAEGKINHAIVKFKGMSDSIGEVTLLMLAWRYTCTLKNKKLSDPQDNDVTKIITTILKNINQQALKNLDYEDKLNLFWLYEQIQKYLVSRNYKKERARLRERIEEILIKSEQKTSSNTKENKQKNKHKKEKPHQSLSEEKVIADINNNRNISGKNIIPKTSLISKKELSQFCESKSKKNLPTNKNTCSHSLPQSISGASQTTCKPSQIRENKNPPETESKKTSVTKKTWNTFFPVMHNTDKILTHGDNSRVTLTTLEIDLPVNIKNIINYFKKRGYKAGIVGSQVWKRILLNLQNKTSEEIEETLKDTDFDLVVNAPRDIILAINNENFSGIHITPHRIIVPPYNNLFVNTSTIKLEIFYSEKLNISYEAEGMERDTPPNAIIATTCNDNPQKIEMIDTTKCGIPDILDKCLKTVTPPEESFSKDAIRMIRYTRTLSSAKGYFQFAYHPSILAPHLNKLENIEQGQLYFHLSKSFMNGQAIDNFKLLLDYRILPQIFKDIDFDTYKEFILHSFSELDKLHAQKKIFTQVQTFIPFVISKVTQDLSKRSITPHNFNAEYIVNILTKFKFTDKLINAFIQRPFYGQVNAISYLLKLFRPLLTNKASNPHVLFSSINNNKNTLSAHLTSINKNTY